MVGFVDRSREKGYFGANLGRAIVTNGDLTFAVMRRLPKLLWADLLLDIITDRKADIVNSRCDFAVFVPQRRHVPPIIKTVGTAEGTEGPIRHAKFHIDRCIFGDF